MKIVDNQNNTTFAHLNDGVQSMDYQYITPPPHPYYPDPPLG